MNKGLQSTESIWRDGLDLVVLDEPEKVLGSGSMRLDTT